jgi:probable HAF family extracellular repeat protein
MNHLFKHYRLASGFHSIAALACLALGVSTGLGAGLPPGTDTVELPRTAYTVTDLGVVFGKKNSVAAAINKQGQVTGTSSNDTSSEEAAFRFDGTSKAGLENLGLQLTGSLSRGFGINDFGVVAGDSSYFTQSQDVRQAVLFSNGSATDLGTLKEAGPFSRANGINASGQVVGFAGPGLDSEKSRAFIWSKTTGMLDLGTLGGPFAQAVAINDAGFVTGNSHVANVVETVAIRADEIHAFLYWPFSTSRVVKAMRDLGTLGGSFSYGTAINSKNHVAGYSTINNSENRVHAFFYDGISMRDLGSLGGVGSSRIAPKSDQSVALGINAKDTIVGYSYLAPRNTRLHTTQPEQQVAFIYRGGVMTDLNALIGDAAEQYLLYSANGINDKGQIAATAFVEELGAFHAVLLTPLATSR